VEGGPLGRRQAVEQLLLDLIAGSAQVVERGPAGRCQRDRMAAPVGGIGLALDQVVALQRVDHRHGWAAQTPTRRLATEDDVARVAVFLASAANASTTGTEIRVDGGRRG
jgi:NAD(P)-dependent dehydrogenase (short-subunit alcohol dehydrogenase family)